MTEEKKTDLRIRSAKVVGLEVAEMRPFVGVVFRRMDGTGVEIRWNPLDNPADCEALLVATLERGWRLCSHGSARYLQLRFTPLIGQEIHVEGNSREPDPRAAFREAVTRACVAAWESENK